MSTSLGGKRWHRLKRRKNANSALLAAASEPIARVTDCRTRAATVRPRAESDEVGRRVVERDVIHIGAASQSADADRRRQQRPRRDPWSTARVAAPS